LLVGLDESLKLDVEVLILALKHGTVLINCIALIFDIIVSLQEILIIESKVFLLFSGNDQLVLDISQLGFTIKYLGVQISVSCILIFSLSL